MAKQGVKSQIGREWLSTLQHEIALRSQKRKIISKHSIEKVVGKKLSEETK